MARPAKTAKIIKMEGNKDNRTKRELALREKGEAATLSKTRLKEWPEVKDDPVAHKEFKRLKRLFGLIDKDDDLYGDQVNRMCKLSSEIRGLLTQRDAAQKRMDELDPADFGEPQDYWKTWIEVSKQIQAIDSKVDKKRMQRMAMEKENCMSIAGALRTVQKTVPKENPLKEALYGT